MEAKQIGWTYSNESGAPPPSCRGLKNAHFEFSVYSNIGSTSDISFQTPELQSANFFAELKDSVNNLGFDTPLQAPESTDAKSVLPDEGIFVVEIDLRGAASGACG